MANITERSRIDRIINELEYMGTSEEVQTFAVGIIAENEDFTELRGLIAGPFQTPYEGGYFAVEIKVPENYPMNPPAIKFVTKIWHPNINSDTGELDLHVLQEEWDPGMTLLTVLLSLQSLLSNPDANYPQDASAISQYIEDPEVFKLTAKFWTHIFAGAEDSEFYSNFHDKLNNLMNNGVNEERALVALSSCSWDLEKAAQLLSG